MSKKTDLRILKTKKAIKKAFLVLIKQKNYSKITIQDIADEAMINRNTFYLHYLDKDDFLDQVSTECFHKLETSMNSNKNIQSINDLSYYAFNELNNSIFRVIEEDFDFYKVILGDDSIPYLSVKFTNIIKNHIGSGVSTTHRDFYVEYMVSGFIGIIRYWIKHPEKYTIDEISKMMIEIYSKDMIELLKN